MLLTPKTKLQEDADDEDEPGNEAKPEDAQSILGPEMWSRGEWRIFRSVFLGTPQAPESRYSMPTERDKDIDKGQSMKRQQQQQEQLVLMLHLMLLT
ncbi:GM26262 [Drosophila sechellia]|uniref:GM26262 n=1 Tax=Drosophila sechellia TaxID=7238 RepID=B4IE80_DROSE|nr:GM26262 [Drosophila sechellia]